MSELILRDVTVDLDFINRASGMAIIAKRRTNVIVPLMITHRREYLMNKNLKLI